MNRFRILTTLLSAVLLASGALASCHAKTEKPMTSATEPFASGVTEAPTDAPQSTEKPQETTKKPQQTTKKPETTKKPQETGLCGKCGKRHGQISHRHSRRA